MTFRIYSRFHSRIIKTKQFLKTFERDFRASNFDDKTDKLNVLLFRITGISMVGAYTCYFGILLLRE